MFHVKQSLAQAHDKTKTKQKHTRTRRPPKAGRQGHDHESPSPPITANRQAAPRAPRPDPTSIAFPFPLGSLFLSSVTRPRRPLGAAGTARQRRCRSPSSRPAANDRRHRRPPVVGSHRPRRVATYGARARRRVHAHAHERARSRRYASARTSARRRPRRRHAGDRGPAPRCARAPVTPTVPLAIRSRFVAGRPRPSAHRERQPAMPRSHG